MGWTMGRWWLRASRFHTHHRCCHARLQGEETRMVVMAVVVGSREAVETGGFPFSHSLSLLMPLLRSCRFIELTQQQHWWRL